MPTFALSGFDDALAAVDALLASGDVQARNGWSLARVLTHAANGIEYSMTRYPQYKPALFRATIGRIALRKFLRQGYMRHDRTADIPGEPTSEGRLEDAVMHFRRAVEAFRAFEGELAPHFAYGPVTKDEYERIHAMHLADHLGEFVARSQAA
jgi:hypothetical protein